MFFFFFFFQAEDGIRDTSVTGVQTCALPISRLSSSARTRSYAVSADSQKLAARLYTLAQAPRAEEWRSEERRVGKECRYGWERGDEKEKQQRNTATECRQK